MSDADRIASLEAEVAALRKHLDEATHKVITCGVAASHPDPTLSRRKAYGGKWDSPQAEEVRALREKYDDLLYQVGTKHPDETRHETAKRWLREREARAANDIGSGSARWPALDSAIAAKGK